MSKRSKERRRLMAEARQREAINNLTDESKQPIIGDMATRVQAIVKAEGNGDSVGHVPVADDKLPKFYHAKNCGCKACRPDDSQSVSAANSGYVNTYTGYNNSKLSDIGYRPINHESDNTIFRVASPDILSPCPIAKVPKVMVPTRLWNEWIALAEDYNIEWLAYLVGRYIEDSRGSRYEITKIYFPPQVGQAAHVDVDDDFESYQPDTIGAVHSHVQMGVFFSGEDLRHSNWPVEIVINAKGDVEVMVRQHLACGQWAKNKSELLTIGDAADNRYISALDKAFEAGDKLRAARLQRKSAAVGYRTPDSQPSASTSASTVSAGFIKEPLHRIPANPANADEWPFKINGQPHKWNDKANNGQGGYERVFKLGSEWLTEAEVNKIDTDSRPTDPKASMSIDEQLSMIDASVEINEETGQIIIQGENASENANEADEVSRMMEDDSHPDATGDSGNRPLTIDPRLRCPECDGEGFIFPNANEITRIECTACGGRGIRIDEMWQGYEGYTC